MSPSFNRTEQMNGSVPLSKRELGTPTRPREPLTWTFEPSAEPLHQQVLTSRMVTNLTFTPTRIARRTLTVCVYVCRTELTF